MAPGNDLQPVDQPVQEGERINIATASFSGSRHETESEPEVEEATE